MMTRSIELISLNIVWSIKFDFEAFLVDLVFRWNGYVL